MNEPNFQFIEKWAFDINIFILGMTYSHSKINPKMVMATSLCKTGL